MSNPVCTPLPFHPQPPTPLLCACKGLAEQLNLQADERGKVASFHRRECFLPFKVGLGDVGGRVLGVRVHHVLLRHVLRYLVLVGVSVHQQVLQTNGGNWSRVMTCFVSSWILTLSSWILVFICSWHALLDFNLKFLDLRVMTCFVSSWILT